MMRSFFTENLSAKLLALIFAISLELYFVSPQNLVTETIVVPVQLRNVPPKRVIVAPPLENATVEVKVRGPSPLMQSLRAGVYQFVIDLPPTALDRYQHRFDGRELGLPPGLEVVELSPQTLDLALEPLASKSIAVRVDTVGALPPGLVLEAKRVQPPTVIARGPMSALRGLHEVVTQKVDIARITAPTELELPLLEHSPAVSLDVTVVTVELSVQPKLDERIFPRVRIRLRGNAATAVNPPTAKVILKGASAKLGGVVESEIELFADTADLPEGRHQVALQATSPPDTQIVRIVPETVFVAVGK